MRKSVKLAAVVAMLFLAFGAVVLAYANSQNALTSSNGQNPPAYTANSASQSQSQNMQSIMGKDRAGIKRFLENATITMVNGTVVSMLKGMLILETGSSEVRILVPKYWSVGTEVVGRWKLFNSTYSFSAPGQNVTVKALKSEIFENPSFSINVMVGYEITNATGTTAYAVLPFNIVPSS
ncbi:MAG: hypothetical protein ABR962_01765 [Candidatus Bathyarchaeia archaeon]|jgi:hypothetical protein